MFESSLLVRSCLVAGTLLIGIYVIFGGTSVSRRKRRRKDDIPGLANIGNSCFLNALVQSLASCPVFVSWLSNRHTHTAPPLLNTLHNLLKALNNEGESSGDACAGEVLGALRGHGWVITSEEQDTHELFHVLTTTIEDEIISGAPVPSLLDVSWLDKQDECSSDGVALRSALCKVTGTLRNTKSSTHREEKLNGTVCGRVHDLSRFGLCDEYNSGDGSKGGEGNKGGDVGQGGEVKKGCDGEVKGRCDDVEVSKHDKYGCESFPRPSQHQGKGEDSAKTDTKLHETVRVVVTSAITTIEKTDKDNKRQESQDTDVNTVKRLVIPECDDNKNVKDDHYKHKGPKEIDSQGRTGEVNARRKSRADHHHDIPFRGYLASQLQCTICGHKNPAQWSSFESLSLSLPSLPWSEVSLQELLGAYITREQVSGVSCDGCSCAASSPVKTTFTKQLTIGKLPECLCFHVKRTMWLENGSAIKRRDHVTFPEFLVMDPYTYTTSITAQAGKKSGYDGNASSLLANITSISQHSTITSLESSSMRRVAPVHYDQLYRLQAVIVHVGDVFCGHFVTYRRGPVNSRSKSRWFYTSDLLVREATLEEVRKANAYMILYEKVA